MKTGMTPKQVNEYAAWLRGQIVHYFRNPQVCRTFHECLTKLQSITGQPLEDDSGLPEDRS